MMDDYDLCSLESFSQQLRDAFDNDDLFVYIVRIGESSTQDRLKSYFDDVNRQVTHLTYQYTV
jgi:hypothetical protein